MPHFGGTAAHQLVDALFAAIWATDPLIGPEDQAFKCLIALLTMKLKNWHGYSLNGEPPVTSSTQPGDKNKERSVLALWFPLGSFCQSRLISII
jgi:hypothetical protein